MKKEGSEVLQLKHLLYIYLIFLLHLVGQVISLGQVEVVLKTLSTSNATLADGTTTCKNGKCKIKMKVTFTQPVPSPKEYKTKYLNLEDSLELAQTGAGALNDGTGTEFDNPINVTAPAKGKLKQFSVTIRLDDYSNFRKLEMATLELTENVTTGFVYNRTLTQHSVSVTLSYKVICEENYYFDCSVFCVGKNDSQMGHYTCDKVTGGKVCLEGWAGDDCLIRICSTNREVTGGRIISTPQAIYKENDTITIECDEDYQLNPHLKSNILVCEATGHWSFNNFTKICTKSGCGGCSRLKEPKHGKLTYRLLNYCQNAKINSTVSVTCFPHYTSLIRYPGLTCGKENKWVNSTGDIVVEKQKHFIDCIASGDSDMNVSEETLKKRLAQSAMVVGGSTFFSFFFICFLYYLIFRRRDKKNTRKVFPRRKSYIPDEVEDLGENKTLKSVGIGNVSTRNSTALSTVTTGQISVAAFDNHGYAADNNFDYEF